MAPLYVPGDIAPADLIERLASEMSAIYQNAETRILAQLARRAERSLGAVPDLTARLQAVQELRASTAAALANIDPNLATEVIRIATESGTAAAAARLNLATFLPATTPFTTTSIVALAQLSLDLQNTYETLSLRILRWDQDEYQRLIAGNVPNILIGVNGRLEAQKGAIQQWLREGIPGFVDKAGRPWRVGSYVEMATRTAVSRAYTDAGIYRMQQTGINLVTVVVGSSACNKCAPWIGQILSTDGMSGPRIVQHATEDRNITVNVASTLDQARIDGLFHPNCRCVTAAYLPGLDIPYSATTYDPRMEAARDKQRSIERDIRQSKRDLAVSTDADEIAEAKQDIRDSQAKMRAHVQEYELPRKANREQVRFADGTPVTP
jgi:hypothetical protein